MRLLTRAEAVVIQSLLASEPVTDREQIRRSGLPSRTFEVARNRVLAAGWVHQTYVPDPLLLGRPQAFIVFAHPYAEHFQDVVARWKQTDGNVVLWRGGTSVLGVFLRSSSASSLTPTFVLGDPERYSRVKSFQVDLCDSEIPVYFDFEGGWSRVAKERPPVKYPRSFPDRERIGPTGKEASPAELRLMETVSDSSIHSNPPTSRNSRARSNAGREEIARALTAGLVSRRAFLRLQSLPGYGAWNLRQIAFLTGRLRRSSESNVLLQTLNGHVGVTPFLFVSDGADVLSGFLSPSPGAPERGPPSRTPSLIGTLQAFLSEIHVTREPIEDLTAVVDHEYSRLFSHPAPGASGHRAQ
jgi:hypothetical protein